MIIAYIVFYHCRDKLELSVRIGFDRCEMGCDVKQSVVQRGVYLDVEGRVFTSLSYLCVQIIGMFGNGVAFCSIEEYAWNACHSVIILPRLVLLLVQHINVV